MVKLESASEQHLLMSLMLCYILQRHKVIGSLAPENKTFEEFDHFDNKVIIT